MKKTLSSVY